MLIQNTKFPRVIDFLERKKMYAELKQKKCTKCEAFKQIHEFTKRSDRPTGKACWCKDCLNEWRRIYKSKHKAKYAAYETQRGLRRNYAISLDIYEKIYKKQKGKCACCGTHERAFKRKLHVDHDHKTREIRALLCTKCNPGLGYFNHSVKNLKRAITYLNKFKK